MLFTKDFDNFCVSIQLLCRTWAPVLTSSWSARWTIYSRCRYRRLWKDIQNHHKVRAILTKKKFKLLNLEDSTSDSYVLFQVFPFNIFSFPSVQLGKKPSSQKIYTKRKLIFKFLHQYLDILFLRSYSTQNVTALSASSFNWESVLQGLSFPRWVTIFSIFTEV